MTRPDSTPKVLLVADPRGSIAGGAAGPVRRFRLARLRYEPRGGAGGDSATQLKRN